MNNKGDRDAKDVLAEFRGLRDDDRTWDEHDKHPEKDRLLAEVGNREYGFINDLETRHDRGGYRYGFTQPRTGFRVRQR